MKKILILVAALALVGAACNKKEETSVPNYTDGTINIAGKSISFEIAETTKDQEIGLSGRDSIEENQGMLFLFQVPEFETFWMKGMHFPIDIIWIKGDEIVDITADAQPEPGVQPDNLKTYTSKSPSDRVLELKSGWAARNGLKKGDKIEIIREVK